MLKQILSLAAGAAILATAQGSASAQETSPETEEAAPPNIMFVLDSSGSMWGQIDGETKRNIARAALSNIAAELPSEASVGLMAYGHRREGDCSDIELLQDIEPGGATTIAEAASGIRSVGKTPLSSAVLQAATTLAPYEGNSAVILITDGIETCGIDPCALSDELDQRGVRIKTHIVGFGLSDDEGQQVACLAEDTGGLYLPADSAGELNDALGQAVEDVTEASGPASLNGEFVTLLALDGDGNLITDDPVRWSITSAAGAETPLTEAAVGFDERVTLPAGDYTLTARHGEVEIGRSFTVEADAENIIEIRFIDGTIVLTPKLGPASEPLRGVYNWKMVRVSSTGERIDAASEPEDTVTFTLPPGSYDAIFSSKGYEAVQRVNIRAGETVERDFVLNAGRLVVSAANTSGVGEFKVLDTSGEEIVRDVTTRSRWFLLSPGTYTVVASFGGAEQSADVSMGAGEERDLTITFP